MNHEDVLSENFKNLEQIALKEKKNYLHSSGRYFRCYKKTSSWAELFS